MLARPGPRRAFLVSAVCATAVLVSCNRSGSPEPLPSGAYTEDFDEAWAFIGGTYAYFDQKAVDWERVRALLRPRAAEVRDHAGFVVVLEELVEHLCDHHAHLGVNTASSPRLVPNGADLWATYRGGVATITAVRAGSAAERSGFRAGMEVVSIDGVPVAAAVDDRLPEAVAPDDPAAHDWALRTLLAGRHDAPVRLEVRNESGRQEATFEPGQRGRPEAPLTARSLGQGIWYVRLHDSLGETTLVRAWDAALQSFKDTDALILDLRDTPGGGDTIVAVPLLGRLVSSAAPYQRHELPARSGHPGRTWTETVRPRGPFTYDKPIAVLVGRWTGSMGEGVAIALDGMGRAAVFGSPMAGLRGAIATRVLEHTKIPVRVPAERLYHVDGTPREAFVPPFPVAAGPGDPVLAAAVSALARGQPGTTSNPRP